MRRGGRRGWWSSGGSWWRSGRGSRAWHRPRQYHIYVNIIPREIDHNRDTGQLLHRYSTHTEPDGVLRVPCKTRRATRCPACADTYQLVRAGLVGGKGVPETVAAHPALFVTLTAPSFGAVHVRREKNGKVLPCHARRDAETCPHGHVMSCTARHGADDPRLGEPLCAECYDYEGSVLFNAVAPELWRRFTEARAPECIRLPNDELRVWRSDLMAWLESRREAV